MEEDRGASEPTTTAVIRVVIADTGVGFGIIKYTSDTTKYIIISELFL